MRFSFSRDIGLILLGAWLILTGLFMLVGGGGRVVQVILGLLAIAAGVLILIGGDRLRSRNYGFLVLAVFLIVDGIFAIIPVVDPAALIILGLLALAAGILILLAITGLFRGVLATAGAGAGTRTGTAGGGRVGYWGFLLLAIWLILIGLVWLASLSFIGITIVLGLLAIAAGILILIQA